MLFNSYTFALFFVITLALHRALKRQEHRLWLLFVAGSVFYGSWSPPYLLLLYASILVDWWVGLALERHDRHRRSILMASLALNLGVLGFFKYADFLLANAAGLARLVGVSWTPKPFGFELPLGISFYTFLTLSYTIDVYRRRVKAEPSLLKYGVFVTFFPHLIAGPILRAEEFLPQVHEPRPENLRSWFGLNRIAIGLMKKVIVADALARFVEPVYAAPSAYDGPAALVATYAYAFQIFFDFSGYCDIAIGTAAMLGYDLPINFDSPYLARHIADFWRRWHISLSSWLRDYLYVTLGGNRKGVRRTYANLLLTMLLGGLWHGAAWTFVVWGALHGLYLVVHRLATHRESVGLAASGGAHATHAEAPDRYRFSWAAVAWFQLVCVAWVFFRAPSFAIARGVLRSVATIPAQLAAHHTSIGRVAFALALSPALLWVYAAATRLRRRAEGYEPRTPVQSLAYGTVMAGVATALAALAAPAAQFIYFQF